MGIKKLPGYTTFFKWYILVLIITSTNFFILKFLTQ